MNLRDSLLDALRTLPGTRHFHLHVLVTAPKKNSSLYPFAHPRPRIYAQDILVLLSEQSPTLDSPRILVSAIEAALYHVPNTNAAILYISKVDGTGQGLAPSPTATLVNAFVRWYADPETRPITAKHLWVHLFARAQGQYLFPNSADYEGKKPLNDVRLCAWWRRVLGKVASEVQEKMHEREKEEEGASAEEGKGVVRLYYVLPGYNELEAYQSLGAVSSSFPTSSSGKSSSASTSVPWTYGHHYDQHEIPLPCPPPPEGLHNLGHYIPSFEDDPKNRFMDEISVIGDADTVKSPVRKRPRLLSVSEEREKEKQHEKDLEKEKEKEKDKSPPGELKTVTPAEFWERMSFRQECIAGAVTGFFVAGFSAPSPHPPPSTTSHSSSSKPVSSVSKPSPLAPQPGQVPVAMNKRILTSLMTGNEFSTVEAARKATEVIEGAIRGLCENLSSLLPPPSSSSGRPPSSRSGKPPSSARTHAPPPSTSSKETRSLTSEANAEVKEKEKEKPKPTLLEVPRTPPRKNSSLPSVDDISPNPFDEPETTLETYHAHIYGTVYVDNPPLVKKTARSGQESGSVGGETGEEKQKVNVLAVRKKKKKVEAA